MEKYTKEQESIRMALTNYIGSLYSSGNFTGELGKNNVNGIIIEEILNLSKDPDGNLSMLAIKPIFNACAWSLRKRKDEMIKSAKTEEIKKTINPLIEEMNVLINKIEKYAEKIK